MQSIIRLSAAGGVSLLLAFPLLAQAQAEQEIRTLDEGLRRLEQLEQATQLERESSRYQHIEGGPVSLAEVMRDPDNLELNFRYAQTQVANGRLRGAAATLERILLIDPALPRVRLYYASVLYRLDSVTEARLQLAQVDRAALSAAQRARADELAQRLERRARRTTYTARIGAGVTYQSNANFAPDDEKIDAIVEVAGVPVPLTDVPVEEAEDDFALVGLAGLGFRHDLGYQQRHELFGSVDVLWNEQRTVDSTDYRTLAGTLGGVWRPGPVEVTGRVLGGHFQLDRASFLRYLGAEIDLARDFVDGALRAHLRQRTTYEDYDSAGGNTPERTGPRIELELGATWRLARNQLLGLSLELTDKRAEERWREYQRAEIGLAHTWLAGRGVHVRNEISLGRDIYDAPNPRISPRKRGDHELRYRLSVGAPLATLTGRGVLPAALADVRLSVAAEYDHTASNIQNFEYTDVRGELFLTKRFEF